MMRFLTYYFVFGEYIYLFRYPCLCAYITVIYYYFRQKVIVNHVRIYTWFIHGLIIKKNSMSLLILRPLYLQDFVIIVLCFKLLLFVGRIIRFYALCMILLIQFLFFVLSATVLRPSIREAHVFAKLLYGQSVTSLQLFYYLPLFFIF